MIKMSVALRNALLVTDSFKDALDGGRLYWFAGPVPATAEEALDIGGDHTLLAEFTESDDGVTGLTWASTATAGSVQKAGAESWASTAAATGTATFFRFCESGDDGEGAASTTLKRFQGTIGSDALLYDLFRANPAVTASDSLTVDAASFGLP